MKTSACTGGSSPTAWCNQATKIGTGTHPLIVRRLLTKAWAGLEGKRFSCLGYRILSELLRHTTPRDHFSVDQRLDGLNIAMETNWWLVSVGARSINSSLAHRSLANTPIIRLW